MEYLYNQIKQKLSLINFNALWPTFTSIKFALYNDTTVYLEDEIVERDNRFIGNTAILFNGDYMAIWYIDDLNEVNIDSLTSKIVHEMFHAFQNKQHELRLPNEFAGLDYRYDALNLSIKYEENKLLASLVDHFENGGLNQFLKLRTYRETIFSNEIEYETKMEVFEGMAEYVELLALKQLNKDLYTKQVERLKQELLSKNYFKQLRMFSYHVGSLLLILLKENNIPFDHTVGQTEETIYKLLSKDITLQTFDIPIHEEIACELINYIDDKNKVIQNFISQSKKQINCDYKIIGFDPLNSFKIDNKLYCKHFIAYFDETGASQFLIQELVVEMNDENRIARLYLN